MALRVIEQYRLSSPCATETIETTLLVRFFTTLLHFLSCERPAVIPLVSSIHFFWSFSMSRLK
jgi:hypothetical protein